MELADGGGWITSATQQVPKRRTRRRQTNAILVGQQIGEKPNSYQEAREMQLPNSHWKVRYSVKFYRFVVGGENVIRPDQEIIPSWDEFKSGRDPVLEWVLNYGAGSNPPAPPPQVTQIWPETPIRFALNSRCDCCW